MVKGISILQRLNELENWSTKSARRCFQLSNFSGKNCTWVWLGPVWPDWAIYWTLDTFLKPLATINLSNSPTFLGDFCKDVKIYHFSGEIIFGHFYRHLAIFFWSHCSPCSFLLQLTSYCKVYLGSIIWG